MIKFKKITAENFLSFEHLELDLDNQGLVLVAGINEASNSFASNGSGKSSLMNAITYALYGQTITGETSDAVINEQAGKGTQVILEFDHDEQACRVERYRKDKTNKNKVKLFIDDTEVTESTASKTNARILQLFGLDLGTYANTIMYGQGDQPIFSQATDKEKKEILENLVDIQVYARAREIAKEKGQSVQGDLDKLVQNEIPVLESQKTQLLNQQAYEKQTYEEALKNIVPAQEQLKDDEEGLKVAQLEVPNKIKVFQNDINNLIQPDSGVQTKVQDVTNRRSQLQNKVFQVSSQVDQAISTLNNLKKQYQDSFTAQVCPTCGQPLTEEHRQQEQQNILAQVEQVKQQAVPAKASLPELQGQLDKLDTELNGLNQQYGDYQKNYSDYVQKLNQLKGMIDTEKLRLNQAQTSLKTSQNLVDSLKVSKPNDHTAELEELDKKHATADKKREKLSQKVAIYDKLVKGAFSNSGIKSMVLDQVTPFINEHANQHLANLSGSDMQVYISTQAETAKGDLKDKFSITVENQNGGNSYEQSSTGERKRIDLAISFALRDLVISKSNLSTNMAVYDECFDGLDEVGSEHVIEDLEQELKTIGTIFVITHNEHLKPLFPNTVTVVKDSNGISTIKRANSNADNS